MALVHEEIKAHEDLLFDFGRKRALIEAEFAEIEAGFGKEPPKEEAGEPEAGELDWPKAKGHFDAIVAIYREMEGMPGVDVQPALLFVFGPLIDRFNGGERTQDLFDEMMDVE